MTISSELIQRYKSEVDVDFLEVLILSQSSMGNYYLVNAPDGASRQAVVDGVLRTFIAIPFTAIPPARDGEGQQDMALAICNIGLEMTNAVEQAALAPSEPIRCRYSTIIEGDTALQIDPPLELQLTDIQITSEVLQATATRANTFGRQFPYEVYRGDRWPGLVRR